MKKFFWTMCAIILATTSCQIGGDDDEVSGGTNKPAKGAYEVGQLYESGSVKGVVFQVDSKGKHGKIVSLTSSSNSMSWDDACAWCNGQGEGWYLPTIDELWVIFRNKNILDKTLDVTKGANTLGSSNLWSSTEYEYDDERAYYFWMAYAYTYAEHKDYTYYARAVRAF